jgi:hypothetical protein
MDAITVGSNLGVSTRNSKNYESTATGTASIYKAVSHNLRSYRLSQTSEVDFFNQSDPDQKIGEIVDPPDNIKTDTNNDNNQGSI